MTQPTTKVKAVAYDAKLGGRDFDYRLAEYLGNVAVEQMKVSDLLPSSTAPLILSYPTFCRPRASRALWTSSRPTKGCGPG